MRILISHVNYPSQFRRILPHWVRSGHEIIFLARNHEWHASDVSGFRLLKYSLNRTGGGPYIHPYYAVLKMQCLKDSLQLKPFTIFQYF